MSTFSRSSPAWQEMARFGGARPAVGAGLRAAVVTVVPLLAAHLLDRPDLAWMGVGGFVTALLDAEGNYRSRATNLAAITATAAVAAVVAALLGDAPGLAVAGVLVWATGGAFLRVYGPIGLNSGLTSSVVFVISMAHPGPLPEAMWRGAWIAAGGLWTAMLALHLWPFRPHRPSYRAVARCYRALAAYAGTIARTAQRPEDSLRLAGRGFEPVREALDEARKGMASGGVSRGHVRERLIVLLEAADQMLGALVALADVVEHVPEAEARASLAEATREMEALTAALAESVESGDEVPPMQPQWTEVALTEAAAPRSPGPASLQAVDLIWRLREAIDAAWEAAAGFRFQPVSAAPARAAPGAGPLLRPLRGNLRGDSLLLRHALRVGVTTGIAASISQGFGLEHGFWIPMTVLFIMQPYSSLTWVRGMQRVVGTVLGGVVAALVPHLVGDPLALLGVMFLLVTATVASWPVNYAIFAFFVTPTFVLLAEMQAGVWTLHEERVLYTVAGGLLAIAGSRLLWELPERRQFPSHAAAVLNATRDYLGAVVADASGRLPDPGALPALRREIGVAILNAGASFQRLVLEAGSPGDTVEPQRTILIYLRRLASAAVAFAAAPPPAPEEAGVWERLVCAAQEALSEIAEAISAGRAPAPLPAPSDPLPRDAALRQRLERLHRPIRVLHATVARAAQTA